MKQQTRWMVVLIALLSVTALACQALGGLDTADTPTDFTQDSPADSAPDSPDAVPEEVAPPAPVDEGPLDLSTVNTDLAFDSYRYSIAMTLTEEEPDGTAVTQTITGEVAVTTDPPATSMTFNLDGMDDAAGMESMTMTTLGDETYMIIPEFGCITTGQIGDALENPFADLAQPNALLEGVDGAERVLPDETVNGVVSRHYVFDESFIDDPQSEVESLDGHLYISAEEGYLVQMAMEGTGSFALLDEAQQGAGTFGIEWNLLEVDGDVEITLPEGCEAGGVSEFPQLPDATEVSSFAGFMSYSSASSLGEAQQFYVDSLTEEGWIYNEDESFISDETVIMVFERGEELLNLTMGVEDEETIFVLLATE